MPTEGRMKKLGLMAFKVIQLFVLATWSLWLFPVVWILSRLYHQRPPNMVYDSQVLRYLRYAWTATPQNPPMDVGTRIWLTLCVVQQFFQSPISGLAWLLDEVLYGQQLDAKNIDTPFFVISAGRSGSTQLTRYLEQDPIFVAPNILMCLFPYLWLWKLVPLTIGKVWTQDAVREFIMKQMPPESLERHEMDPFQADTFDVAFMGIHLGFLSLYMGPVIGAMEFSMADFAPHNQSLVEKDYIQFIDRIARKTMLYNGKNTTMQQQQPERRFYLKGHFLLAAPALAQKYPSCTMVTVVRDPLRRLQSTINFLRVNPADPYLGHVPWTWLTQALVETEARYCEVEYSFFASANNDENDDTNNDPTTGVNKCVIRFDDFVQDLEGCMSKVYKECLGRDDVHHHIPNRHDHSRNRSNYSVNKSLEELGVDQDIYRRRVHHYIRWIEEDLKKQHAKTTSAMRG